MREAAVGRTRLIPGWVLMARASPNGGGEQVLFILAAVGVHRFAIMLGYLVSPRIRVFRMVCLSWCCHSHHQNHDAVAPMMLMLVFVPRLHFSACPYPHCPQSIF